MHSATTRRTYDLSGVVQGVGFRPAVYRLAEQADLSGWIQNRAGTVRLCLEGPASEIDAFIRILPERVPANADIETVTMLSDEELDCAGTATGFSIIESRSTDTLEVVIPADLSLCPDCAREILDPNDRRYGYAFTTCTNCGPRYTVTRTMPYDRERTTMAVFPLCDRCQREYRDPSDRRFHAETTACPDCGPRLSLAGAAGAALGGDALRRARLELARGAVLAVRGIGGYLLATDALNRESLAGLRDRKQRPHKPFAVMARELGVLRSLCKVTETAASLLSSPESPIVILDVDRDAVEKAGVPLELITPDTPTLGAMLPTSPLHRLLFQPVADDPTPPFDLLVMTSGNRRGEPICLTNAEAAERLRDIADAVLAHDREINLRNDDSLCAIQRGHPQVWRRARGYAPRPIALRHALDRCVLAMGAELKNAIAVGYDAKVVLSPHVGDLDTPEAFDGLRRVVETLPAFLQRTPECVAVDLHPDMHSSILGRELANQRELPLVEVQHHHAHAAGCLAEHGCDSGLALAFDGTGLGTDGNIWGAELLDCHGPGFTRLATFRGVPLPGGDAAVIRPARQLVARWLDAGIDVSGQQLAEIGVSPEELATWEQQCVKGVNAPATHAAGRVFDAFAVLLGVTPRHTTYDGQAAIRLEALAKRDSGTDRIDLPFSAAEDDRMLVVDWREAFRRATEARRSPEQGAAWALALHRAIARAATEMVSYGFSRAPSRTVALSGGVFMNRVLNDMLVPQLEAIGAEVLIHRETPPNDGGISFGQAVIAGRRRTTGEW